MAVYDENNNVKIQYVMGGIDDPIYMIQGGRKFFFHTNHLGSVIAITDEEGYVRNKYDYDAYGNFAKTCPSESIGKPCIPNRYTYTAREWDEDVQLYFYRARCGMIQK